MGCNSTKSTATSSQNGNPSNKPHPSLGFVMSDEELEALKQEFREVDVNNDGSMSVDELRNVFVKHGGFSDEDIQEFIEEADTNGNKQVEFDELVAVLMARMEKEIRVLRIIFNSFDKDNNGVLTKKELKELLQELGTDTSNAHVEEVFNALDDNSDGKITFEEFVSFYTGLKKEA